MGEEFASGDNIRMPSKSKHRGYHDESSDDASDGDQFGRQVSKQSGLAKGVGTQRYDDSIMLSNEVRAERGVPLHHTYREEYVHAQQDRAARRMSDPKLI